jgi:hypothetical protein
MGCQNGFQRLYRKKQLEVRCHVGAWGNQAEEWITFTDLLNSNFIHLREEEDDSIVWSRNEKNGNYTIKLGYLSQAEVAFEGGEKMVVVLCVEDPCTFKSEDYVMVGY